MITRPHDAPRRRAGVQGQIAPGHSHFVRRCNHHRAPPRVNDDVDRHIGCRAPRTSVRIRAGSSLKWSEMANADKRKQSLYFPEDMLQEIQQEAARMDRSLSWVVQQGWKRARAQIKAFPSSNDDSESLADLREE